MAVDYLLVCAETFSRQVMLLEVQVSLICSSKVLNLILASSLANKDIIGYLSNSQMMICISFGGTQTTHYLNWFITLVSILAASVTCMLYAGLDSLFLTVVQSCNTYGTVPP